MSTEIDQRVVEMRFDNKRFESNVSTSISSLEKLKRSLDFKGASRGFENLERSARNVDMDPLGRSVDAVKSKFSALETVAAGALLRIGSQIADVGIKFAEAVTSMNSLNLENITAGWSKFNDKNSAVATLVAQGYSLEKVNEQLDRLNWYTDETSYNFIEMVKSISKFTASGQDLEKSVDALEGIANWAALSGQNATVASAAMYQLSQAMGSGVMRKEDYKSVQNLSMDTVEFRQKALDAGVALGTLRKNADGTYHSLMATGKAITDFNINQFADHLTQDAWFTSDVMMSVYNEYAGAIDKIYRYAEAHGVTAHEAIEALSGELDEFAVKAFKAAQEARSWADVVDSVKDAVSTGWMQTFETIFGDYEESKSFFSQLADDFWDIFASGASARNQLLSEALDTPWQKFSKEIKAVAFDLEGLSDAELEAQGYTREQADEIAALNQRIRDGAPDLKEYVESLSKRPSGRENLAQTIYNIRDALFLVDEETDKAIGFIAVLKEAWSEIFPPMTAEKIYDVTKKLRDFTERLIPSEETADRLKRTFKGLFAVLDIGGQVISAVVRAIAPLLGRLTGVNSGILGVTSSIGDWLVKLDEAIREHDIFFRSLEKVTSIVGTVADAIRGFVSAVGQRLNLPSFDDFTAGLRTLFEVIRGKFDQEGFDRIRSFVDRVKELDGLTLENLKKAFTDFRDNVLGYFLDFGAAFDRMQSKSNGFGGDIRRALGQIADCAEDAKTRGIDALKAFAEAFADARNKIFDVAIDIRSRLAEKIGFAEIFAIGLGTAMVVFTKKIGDALSVIAAPFEGIGKVLTAASKALKAFALKIKSEALKNIAESILMLVGALAVLTLLDQEKLKSAAIVLGVLAAGLLAFSFAMSRMGTPSETARLSVSLTSLGTSLLLIASAMKKLDGLENVGKSFFVITGLMAELLGMSRLMGTRGEKESAAGILSLISMALSLKILVGVIKDIDRLKINNLGRTIGILAAAVAGIIALSAACKGMSLGAGAGMLAMVVALNMLANTFKTLARIDLSQTRTALQSFITVFGMFAAVMVASRFAGENAKQAGSAIFKMSAALMLIVLSFKMMEKIDPLALERTKKIVTELLTVFAVITMASIFPGEHAAKAGTMLLAMSGAIMVLSGAIGLLAIVAKYNPNGLSRALGAVEQLLAFFGALVVLTRFAGETEKILGTLIVMTVAIGVMTAAVGAMTLLDPDKLRGTVTALSVLMTVFGLMIAATHFAEKALGTLAVMTLVVAGLAGIVIAMSVLNVENSIENASAVSLLMAALSASLIAMGRLGTVARSAFATVGIMTAVTAGLGAILYAMQRLNVQPSIETAGALSILLLSMSAACVLIGNVGKIGPVAFIGIGVLAVLIAALGGIMAAICALTADNPTIEQDLDRAVMVLEKIGTGLGAALGGFVGGAIGGLSSGMPLIGANLADFMTNGKPFFDGIRNLDSDVVCGVKYLAEALAILTGAQILDGVASLLSGKTSMSDFAANLVAFGQGIVRFSDIVTDVNPDVVTAAATAGKALAEMADTIPNTGGIVAWFTGENDMGEFAEQLIPFGQAMVRFSNAVDGIDPDAVTNAATAGEALAQMAATIPNTGGIVAWFTGENDIDDFAAQLVPFGKAIKAFSIEVEGLDTDAVSAAASAGRVMVELANTIPNTGGVLGFLAGENDIDAFGVKLISFGASIKMFAAQVEGIETESVQNAAAAGKIMVELAKTIPNTGGIVSWFTGDNDIDAFGKGLTSFGRALVAFSDSKISSDAVENAVNAGQALIELGKTVPNSGGVIGFFTGNSDILDFGNGLLAFGNALVVFSDTAISVQGVRNAIDASDALVEFGKTVPSSSGDLTSFAEGLVPFGRSMAQFSKIVEGLTPDSVENAANAGKIITGLADTIPNSGGLAGFFAGNNDMGQFAEQLIPFGEAMRDFAASVKGVNAQTVNNAVSAGKALSELAKTIPNSGGLAGLFAGNNDIDNFGKKLSLFGTYISDYYGKIRNINGEKLNNITAAIEGLIAVAGNASGASQEFFSDLSSAFESLANIGIDAFIKAIGASEMRVKNAFATLIAKTVISINGKRSDFYSAGTNVGQGFIQGIASKTSAAEKAGARLGQASLDGAKEALDSHSPSREFIEVGENVGDGLIIGTLNRLSQIHDAGERMGDVLSEATRDALGCHSPGKVGEKTGEDHGDGIILGARNKLDAIKDAGVALGNSLSSATKDALSVSSITDFISGSLDRAGADVSNLNFDIFATSKNAVDALNGEAAVAQATANAYQSAANAKKKYSEASIETSAKTYYGGYASEEYKYLTTHLGEGFAIGLSNGIVSANQAISESITEVITMAGKGVDAWENWLNERKYYNRISLNDELAGWEKLQTAYAIGSEERQKIDREVYRVQNELVDGTYQFSLDWIEKEQYYNRLSTEEELAAYERMQSRYMEGSKERMEIDRKVYSLRNQLADESYQASLDWIEEEKYYNRLSLASELAAYMRVQNRYAKGTDERKKMDREVYRVEQEIYEAQKQYNEDVQRVQEEANQKRLDLEREYADKVKSINEQLARDIESENNRYLSALETRTSNLYSSYGLFDEIKEREEVSGDTLMQNLEDQVKEFSEWQDTLDSLSARGLDEGLIEELQQMGPSSISQIKALESMTDSELDKYVALWQVKHGMARAQAVSELEGLRIETLNNISQLREDAETELEDYRESWLRNLEQVNADSEAELARLQQEFGEKVGLIKRDTEAEMQKMADTAQAILKEAGLDTETELQKTADTAQSILNEAGQNTETEMRKIADTVQKILKEAGQNTETEMREMTTTALRILKEAGWYQTGRQIVSGLIQGVEAERPVFIDTLIDMAIEGVQAVKDTLDINSPSRVFQELGSFTGLGFVNGLAAYAQKSYDAGSAVAEEARDGLSDAMRTIEDYLNGDLEAQPTIRPVMDLSNVADGAEMMDSLFYNRRLLALAGQTSFAFGANAGESEMTIHVDNDSVVRELRSLRGEMSAMSDRMAQMQIVLDTGVTVGALAGPMDEALGRRASYRRRGN